MKTAVVDGREIQYWRSLNMYATSYHPANVGSTTASGLPLQKGVAAVDINYVPFYTQMYIPGYGEAVAADIGGGVKGRWIDLGYSDSDYVPWHQGSHFPLPAPANIVSSLEPAGTDIPGCFASSKFIQNLGQNFLLESMPFKWLLMLLR
jgi:3D (Asp-Asp-Asp) domain-containing protein